MQIICPECGKPFDDGDQCWVCVNRDEDMKETFNLSFPVALGGIVGTIFTVFSYPPLGSCWWVFYTIVALIAIPGLMAFELDNFDRLTRYATLVRLMTVLVAATFVLLAAYFYLNGILDGSPPVEAQALVSQKFIFHGRYGNEYILKSNFSWNGKRFEDDDLGVSPETFSASEPGDSVRVIVHPGEFSLPWYSDVLPSSTPVRNSK